MIRTSSVRTINFQNKSVLVPCEFRRDFIRMIQRCWCCEQPPQSTLHRLIDFEKAKSLFLLLYLIKLRPANAHYGEHRLHVCLDIADSNVIHRVSQHFSVGSARNILKSVSAVHSCAAFIYFSHRFVTQFIL